MKEVFGIESENCQYGHFPIFPTVCRRTYRDDTRPKFPPGTYDCWVVTRKFDPNAVVFPSQESALAFIAGFACPDHFSIHYEVFGAYQLDGFGCFGAEFGCFKSK